MDPRSEPDWDSMGEDDVAPSRMFGRQRSLVDEGMKGGADPLLSQEPASVLPSYASLMDTDVGQDFSEDKLMNSGNLYSLFLLNSDESAEDQLTKNDLTSSLLPDLGMTIKKEMTDDDEEEIDVENESGKKESSSPRTVFKRRASTSQLQENGHKACDALFEGMPFYELQGKEVGPCAYCNMWRTIRYMSYCGRYPFCSVNCTKKFAVCKREQGELLEKAHEEGKPAANNLKVPTLFEKHKPRPLFPSSTPKRRDSSSSNSGFKPATCNGIHSNVKPDTYQQFDWPSYLDEQGMEAAPVKCFQHTALSKEWKANIIGALVEVQNRDPEDSKDSFWVARIIRVAGYKAKLRFEGYGMDNSHDFWVHLCKTECYAINGAVKAGMKLKPPKGVIEILGEKWLEHLARISHSGSPTFSLPKDKLKEYLDNPFKRDMKLEVVYKRSISSTCVATVKNVVGDRIHVQYDNCKDPSKDFWFHKLSPLIHPVGWSQRVGHPLVATAAYKSEALDKGRLQKTGANDAPWDAFNMPQSLKSDQSFRVGMKLEVIDPLKLSHICIGTVMHVLNEGYLMIGVDGCLNDQSSWFCYHSNSSSLLPVGFCEYHHIELQPPKDFKGHFDWDDYLRNTNSIATPVELFQQKTDNLGFKVGHKLEAVDLIESGLICAATIVKIAGPLLRVHFDGWDSSYDQWVDCQAPDVYPVGWCEMVSYPLQSPRIHSVSDYKAPLPVFKHNGKKIKISPGLRPDNKKRRALSISFGCLQNAKLEENNLDSVYSFSDDEGMSGYQELLKTAPKPLQNSKKEKKEKKERKSSSKSKHHHHHHHHHHVKNHSKPNGKGRPSESAEVKMQPDLTSGSELKHLLTTIQVAAPTLTPRATPKSSPKAGATTVPSSKKPKKPKASKKTSAGGFSLSSTEASILDDIFSSITKESTLSSSLSSTSTMNNTTFSMSSSLDTSLSLDGLSPKPTITQTAPASKTSITNSLKTAAAASPGDSSSMLHTSHRNTISESIPPTLNKMSDTPPHMQLHSLDLDSSPVEGMSEMPPLIPAGAPDTKPIPDDANKFQDAFLLQLAESLKAKSKKSKSKPKKSRKEKDPSKKGCKSESKRAKSKKKEGKSKEQKKLAPQVPKTSHLAELLMRPGSLDLSKIDSNNDVNGFYVAGASSSLSQNISKVDSVVHNMLQSPTGLIAPPPNGASNSAAKDIDHPDLTSSVSVNTVTVQRNATKVEQKVFHVANGDQKLPQLALKANPQHTDNELMSPRIGSHPLLHNFIMEDDFLQNCIDPNLLHKPNAVRERSNSMDVGLLQRKTTTNKVQQQQQPSQEPVKDEYEFLSDPISVEPGLMQGVPNIGANKKLPKSAANKTKTKAKPKPKPKKKKPPPSSTNKPVIPPPKPAPRSRSSSLPLPSVPQEAQNIMTNGMDLQMVQGMLSPPVRSPNGTLLELERTQHHILSSILQDHASQVVPPEQLLARQKAAMIMQEKFQELQQLQMRMQLSQVEKASMPPLVELRRPPIHMGFPGPQDAMFNNMHRPPGNQQLPPGLRMPMSSAATMMTSMDPRLTSPRMGQPNLHSMATPSPQVPPQSPVMSPNSQQSMVPHSPQSMMVPSPQGMIPPPSPKSFVPRSPKPKAMPSPKSMLPNSPTSMPPPSPSSSMVSPSPQSMLPPSPQSSVGANLQARLQQTSPIPGPANLQPRLQQASPIPGPPTSPMLMQMMQGRSSNQQQHQQQQQRKMAAHTMAPQMPPSTPTMSAGQNMMGAGNPHSLIPPQSAQPLMNPQGMMSPMIRYPATSQSRMQFGSTGQHGHERDPYAFGSPVPSPQASPTGAPPAQKLPPLHSLLRPSSAPHGMSTASLPSPTSNQPLSPALSPRINPNNINLQNQAFSLAGGVAQRVPLQNPPGYHQQHQLASGHRQRMASLGQQMLPGHFQANMPMQQQIPQQRSRGFPVRMGFPSPPPSYPSPTSQADLAIMQQNINRRANKIRHPTVNSHQQETNQQQQPQQHLSPSKPALGIVNPWEWSISDVIQFIADAGEGACAEPFRRQKIDGPQFMSLSKDQLANLTGMKVAPSLKIYQQIVRLRSMFPTKDHATNTQQ